MRVPRKRVPAVRGTYYRLSSRGAGKEAVHDKEDSDVAVSQPTVAHFRSCYSPVITIITMLDYHNGDVI